MPTYVPIPSTSIQGAVTAASVQIAGLNMQPGESYTLTVDCNCYVAQNANPTATNGSGSKLLTPGNLVIEGLNGAKLAIMGDGAATGTYTISRSRVYR